MTIHDFDMARFLLGSEVVEVYTSGAVLVDRHRRSRRHRHRGAAHLRQRRSTSSTIAAAVCGYDQRVEILGSGGAIQTENSTPTQPSSAPATISAATCRYTSS